MARELSSDAEIGELLSSSRTVAVLGAHHAPGRPATYVPEYLAKQGYRVVPVNAQLAGSTVLGEPVRASLAEVGEPVDIVDVFRRSEAIPGHVDDVLAMRPPPRAVWLQQGIRNDEAAARFIAAGIDVVQDRCTLAEHRRLGLGRVGEPRE